MTLKGSRETSELRSSWWLGDGGKNGFIARHHLRQSGWSDAQFDGRPIIGIANTWSQLTPCNLHLRDLANHVRRGIEQSGAAAVEFPVMSLGEPFLRPTSMMFRNLMAMELEEQLRANPLDAVVVLTGCDKTTPAALMAVASADIPAVLLTGGPMLNGKHRGRDVGSGTDIWKMMEDHRAGRVSAEEFAEFERGLNRSAGHCMTMGTASTMAIITEAMGMQLPGAAALPAVDSRRQALAEQTGVTAVEIARSGLRPSQIMSKAAIRNAIVVNAAVGGSTNAVIHLLAIAGRLGIGLALEEIDEVGSSVPLLADVMPSGSLLMEEFAYAGGVPALIGQLADLLDIEAAVVDGGTLENRVVGAPLPEGPAIAHRTSPISPPGSGVVALRGNLAEDGAVLKVSAASPALLKHIGSALVFDTLDDYLAVADDEDLPVTPDTVLIVRNCGPRGYPGMPEVGNLPMPRKLIAAGIRDMVRISDARMSGTAFGTCVLHASPEAAVGGGLSRVRTGDLVRLDVTARRLDALVDENEWRDRSPVAMPASASRGWKQLYLDHVQQAHQGADFDFLVGSTPDELNKAAF